MIKNLQNKKERVVTIGLAIILIGMIIIPKFVNAMMIDQMWDYPLVARTWTNEPDEWIAAHSLSNKKFSIYKKTGLAMNANYYFSLNRSDYNWPLGGQMYLEERPGYDNTGFEDFNLRHTYCTGNHESAAVISPGTRAYLSGTYWYDDTLANMFEEAKRKDNDITKFNFLMLALGCYYPGAYTINKNAGSIAEDSAPAQGLVSQLIAWVCTDKGSPGFIGNWEIDLNTFHTWRGYYEAMMGPSFQNDPAIYDVLHSEPSKETGAGEDGITTMPDAWFYDIWNAAKVSSSLTPNWDKQISQYNTALQQSDGEYYVEIDLFVNNAAKRYLDGISFTPYGDWQYLGPDETGKQRFSSASGELDENGSIGYLNWPSEQIGYFMPIDQTKAKLCTFDIYNLAVKEPAFGRTQTQFAAVIEKGVNIYVTIGNGDSGSMSSSMERFKHSETWESNYNVNLRKFDSETGKAIEDSHWDVLERFDDSQLDDTDLDRTPDSPGSYESGLGGLNSTTWGDDEISSNYAGDMGVTESDTNKYNWGNDGGTQFDRWNDPHNDPCKRDDNVTGADGLLYEINSSGANSGDTAHTDVYKYTYNKGYCTGHPAPEIEYVECDHDEEEDCDCEEINQELHDDAWEAWYEEVKTCEELVEQGGFFHCISPGDTAKTAMENDRDQFHKDFISLCYDYSAEEIKAAKGYILHGTHTDDIPVEWRTVTSSEYKDTDEAASISHKGSSSGDAEDGRMETEMLAVATLEPDTVLMSSTVRAAVTSETEPSQGGMTELIDAGKTHEKKTDAETIPETLTEESEETSHSAEKNKPRKETKASEEDGIIADIDIFDDGTVVSDATGSEATPSNPIPETIKTFTGYIKEAGDKFQSVFTNVRENKASGAGGGHLRNALSFSASKANTVMPAATDIIDWTFIAYDHRTEGEIHFNKQDFDLSGMDGFDAYGQENADGSLEGAVYGLFAADDIVHPDTSGENAGENDTGTVFKKGDLVAITITDRNGDGSFMAITEAPGSVYNYETGKVEHTDWYENAPKNLHVPEADSAAGADDIEKFAGHNPDNSEITAENGADLTDTTGSDGSHTEDFFFKYSSNQLYNDTKQENDTTGRYPISNNEDNNGNCWIGRPLIVGTDGTTYYIKELSRSEGYELSVYGKNGNLITNRNAFEDGDITTSSGVVTAGSIMQDRVSGGVTYTISSNGTDNGYEVHLTNIPEGASISLTKTENVWDDSVSHYEEVVTYEPIMADTGALVTLGGHSWEAALGDTITYNGKNYPVNNVHTVTHDRQSVSPDNKEKLENPYLNAASITESGDVTKDVNKLFSSIGYRNVIAGSPWTIVKADSLTVADIAKAVNGQLFTDNWYSAFNAMQMSDSYYAGGQLYIVISYCYRYSAVNDAIYNDVNDTIYVKTPVEYTGMAESGEGFIYRAYNAADCEDIVRNGSGFITKATVLNQTATGSAKWHEGNPYDTVSFTTRPSETFWAYAEGEQLLKTDGSYAHQEVKETVSVTPTLVPKVTNMEITAGSYAENGQSADGYGYGTYIYTVTQDMVDALENGKADFRLTFGDDNYTAALKELYTANNGHVSITLPMVLSGSYMESVLLVYPGEDTVVQDAGTSKSPVLLQERPIRQKIKVNKDIQTLLEAKQAWYCLNCGYENGTGLAACAHCNTARTTEETKTIQYLNDTYSAVHEDNIPADRNAGAYETARDWLARLLNNKVDGEEAKTIPNFRFKAYLKSNLERLYRDQDGNVIWLDRNGNTMSPKYADTNGDGNYDTFAWTYNEAYEGKEVDFPEKDKLTETGILESSNVQKIYTKVEHNVDSKTTSAQANNVWDDYDTPQAGAMDNVGEKEGFTTSQREKTDGSGGDLSGKAVDTNAALYSYRGKNTNAAQTDCINEGQNTGYIRLLETRQDLMEDEAGTKYQAELYNYEKFFDAIATANADVWDNDMHSTYTGTSMTNYPGQHWFETHYEKYQKDDADPDHTLKNTDGADKDNTAGGDRDTSFKPFRWIREHAFGDRADYENYPAGHNGANTEVTSSTSYFARANAEASDAVRQFAAKWYLEDEAAKLLTDNGVGEDIAKDSGGAIGYDEAVYDEALFSAIAKTYNYLKPFYVNDLDTIYSVEWDSAENGGADQDFTTLSVDIKDAKEHYSVSSYLPYGIYVIVEQQPERRDGAVNDFENRSYTVEKPKEVIVPSVYDAPEANDTADNYDGHYFYQYNMTAQDQAKAENYLIRFAEEWAEKSPQDEREYVIRAHGYEGDYEIYKYGLDIDRLTGAIDYDGGAYDYSGWKLTQDAFDPLKDYYDTKHKGKTGVETIGTEDGGNDAVDYMAIHKTNGIDTANGSVYDGKPLQDRFFYGSISEDAGTADPVMNRGGVAEGKYSPSAFKEDGIRSMTGELTAYEGKYASMLVQWTVTAPADLKQYSAVDFTGYADVNEHDGFYTTMLRINKVDSETGEYILHDNAIFALYAGSRYNTFEEINADAALIADAGERAAFQAQFKPGDAKFYLKDTVIQGTKEFLTAMGATDITPAAKGKAVVESAAGPGELCSGLVKKGTPICVESERIMLTDEEGARTGQMTVYTTLNDVLAAGEKNAADKAHANQNTGYFITPQPIGAGVYVLVEIKAPDGYARSKPVPFEVYSDKTQYYVDGDMYNKVSAMRYEDDLGK